MNNKEQKLFVERVNSIIAARSLKKSDIIRNSGIDRTYGYQILSGRRNPSREKVIKLCLGMKLSVVEANVLLETAKYARLTASDADDEKVILLLDRKNCASD